MTLQRVTRDTPPNTATQTILVCGGRKYGAPVKNEKTGEWAKTPERAKAEREHMFLVLDQLDKGVTIEHLVSGAATGADTVARTWAVSRKIRYTPYAADWVKHGNAAGPIRNAYMLAQSKPNLVVAFPGGTGTADMIQKARRAGVQVKQV